MSETHPYQLHVEPEQIYYGFHPDPAVATEVERHMRAGDERTAEFRKSVDGTNRNAEYSPEIGLVSRLFKRDGMDHAPIVVLSPDNFDKTLATYDPTYSPEDDQKPPDGINLMGRCLVREPETGSSLSKQFYVLGTTLHEAAHSVGHKEQRGVLSYMASRGPLDDIEREYTHMPSDADLQPGDFTKLHLGKINGEYDPHQDGTLLEEGFAEYTRVHYMRELVRTLDIQLPTPEEPVLLGQYYMRLVDSGATGLAPAPDHFIDIPNDYTEESYKCVGTTPTNWRLTTTAFAAYGIELLDKRSPGLYRAMQQSRRQPSLQREFIRHIESVRPGYYKYLRDSPGSLMGNLAAVHNIYAAMGPGLELPRA